MSSVRSRSAPPRLSRTFFENCICASRQVCCGEGEAELTTPRWTLVFGFGVRKNGRRRRDDQATKGTRWMPRRQEAKKDVGSCEKPRGAANQALIRGCPNGETD